MNPMERCCATARSLLSDAAAGLGFALDRTVPLRRRDNGGLLLSALPRRLAAENGGDAQPLAEALIDVLSLEKTPFDRKTAEDGMILLSLSHDWFASVLSDFGSAEWPDVPELPSQRNEENPAFLLAYTARRCRALAERGTAGAPPELPAGLICALAAEGDAGDIARSYWRLPWKVRAYAPLAKAVGIAAGQRARVIYRKFTPL